MHEWKHPFFTCPLDTPLERLRAMMADALGGRPLEAHPPEFQLRFLRRQIALSDARIQQWVDAIWYSQRKLLEYREALFAVPETITVLASAVTIGHPGAVRFVCRLTGRRDPQAACERLKQVPAPELIRRLVCFVLDMPPFDREPPRGPGRRAGG